MSSKALFTQENLDTYLKALAREYKKLGGKGMPAEIILIGGAAILANYGFRESTYDMDALIDASSAMKDAINHVGDEYGLPNGWLNEDFVKTKSYTPKIRQYSVHYKEFGRILEVRTVKAEQQHFELNSNYFYGEFDPGSGRTLAACLIHASRADVLLVLAPI